MSQDPPAPRPAGRADGTTVLDWGTTERRPPGRLGRRLGGLGRDRRLPSVLLALGAVAVAASLVGEWLVTTVPSDSANGPGSLRIPGGVGDVGAFGVAYLVGVLLLAVAVALALRGSPAVRPDAGRAGLAVAAALLALLAATAFSLDDIGQRSVFFAPQDGVQVVYGRGLATAFLGVLLVAAALLLAGRTADPTDPGEQDDPDEAADRRRDELPPAPADLTVTPTVPFARRDPGA